MAKNVQIYHIESDVPVPEDAEQPTVRSTVPLDLLLVGDSVAFPLRLRAAVAVIATRLKRDGKRFTIKKISDTEARVWRVE